MTSDLAPRGPLRHAPGYRRRRFRNWLLLGLLYAGYYMCRYNLTAVTPEMARELHLDNSQTGWFSTVRDIGYAAGNFVNGLFADALGGKQAMAVGAIGTIILNLAFGWVSGWAGLDIAVLLTLLLVIRGIDGYAQTFGAPGMVKTNAAWFRREERGKFAGLFGLVIQAGQAGVNSLSGLMLVGGAIGLFGTVFFVIPKSDWRIMFFVPPAILAVVLVLMWIGVKNYPEEAGFRLDRDAAEISTPGKYACSACDHDLTGLETTAECPKCGVARQRGQSSSVAPPAKVSEAVGGKLPLGVVFRTIAGNPLTWVNAGAYFCTGFVRRASDFWWAKYLDNVWHLGKDSLAYSRMSILLPLTAVGGSFLAGWLSDTFFRSRRSPVAAALYTLETAAILASWIVLTTPGLASPTMGCIALLLISFTCNSSHSIIGTAAVMDIGGPRMAGFTLGVVNCCQYLGAILAGAGLGTIIDRFGWNAAFGAMLPFSALGMLLMISLWLRTRGRDVRGA